MMGEKLHKSVSTMAVAHKGKMENILVTNHELAIKIGQLLVNDGFSFVVLDTEKDQQQVWFYHAQIFEDN